MMHRIARHLPVMQPVPPSANRSPTQPQHADKPAAAGVRANGSQPLGGQYTSANIRMGAHAPKPTARKDMLPGARRQNGRFSKLVDQSDDDGGSSGGTSSIMAALASGGGSSGSGGDGGSGNQKRRDKGDGRPPLSFKVASVVPGEQARAEAARLCADDTWARDALARQGDLGLMNAFADRLLAARTRDPDPDAPGPIARIHLDNRTMLRVTEGRALAPGCVKAVCARLASQGRPTQAMDYPYINALLVPMLMNYERYRPRLPLARAIAKRTTQVGLGLIHKFTGSR